jgi:hypothetical protein
MQKMQLHAFPPILLHLRHQRLPTRLFSTRPLGCLSANQTNASATLLLGGGYRPITNYVFIAKTTPKSNRTRRRLHALHHRGHPGANANVRYPTTSRAPTPDPTLEPAPTAQPGAPAARLPRQRRPPRHPRPQVVPMSAGPPRRPPAPARGTVEKGSVGLASIRTAHYKYPHDNRKADPGVRTERKT